VEQIADVPMNDTAQLHHSGERYHLQVGHTGLAAAGRGGALLFSLSLRLRLTLSLSLSSPRSLKLLLISTLTLSDTGTSTDTHTL